MPSTPFMQKSLQAGHTKLLKHRNKMQTSMVYITAIFLDPRKKWPCLKRWVSERQPSMKATSKKLWETTYRSSTDLATYTSTSCAPLIEATNQYLQWLNEQEDKLPDTVTVDDLDLYTIDCYTDRFLLQAVASHHCSV